MASSDNTEKTHFLIIAHHGCMSNIKLHLNHDNIHYDYKEISCMEELSKWSRDQDTKNQLHSYDMIVSMLGSMDLIRQGRKVYETFNLYKQTITEMKEFANVTVLQIPSTNITLMMNSVDIFNGRIQKLSILNTDKVMISRKICDAAYKSKLVIDDGFSLSDHGGSLYAEMLYDIPIPEAIKKASVNGDTSHYTKI